MELGQTWLWLSMIPLITASIVTIILTVYQLLRRYKKSRKKEVTFEPSEETVTALEELKGRLKELELGTSTIAADQDFFGRLSKIEELVEPLKERPEFSSPEYSLLQYQINKLNESSEPLQNRLERMIEQKFNSFQVGYTIWMLIMTLLFTFAIGLLVYLLPKQVVPI